MSPSDDWCRTVLRDRLGFPEEKAHKACALVCRFSDADSMAHAVAVTEMLAAFHPDQDAMIASLLFSSGLSIESREKDIRAFFDDTVWHIVLSLSKLASIRPDFSRNDTETLRQVILMMAQDIRVMLIRLVDRLHAVQHADQMPAELRKQIAEECLKLYAPLASRLGIYQIKWQLEDNAFRVLNPVQHDHIVRQLETFSNESQSGLTVFQRSLLDFLHSQGVACEITGRVKSVYSIYRKMRRKSTDVVTELHDIFAVRVVTPPRYVDQREVYDGLYSVLGLVHSRWTPLPGRFKDYIAMPKPNGYQSLHTTIFAPLDALRNQPVEIQIRSEVMHREAEYGIAAHWLYEDTRARSSQYDRQSILALVDDADRATIEGGVSRDASSSASPKIQNERLRRQIDWLRALVKQETDDHTDGVERDEDEFRVDVFQDRIFVFTPQGQVKDLPLGATPVDFAYSVHTDIGHRCGMVRVNGAIVPLNAPLKSGDVVEVVLKPKPNPRSEWLSFVKTASARQKIKVWFKSQNRELSFREGRDILNKQLRRLNKPLLDDQLSCLKTYDGETFSLSERRSVIEAMGSGSLSVHTVVKKMFAKEELFQPVAPVPLKPVAASLPLEKRILLGGEAGLPVRLAQCCNPREGDPIFGYVTHQYASIHSLHCTHLQNGNPARVLQARWVSDVASAPRYRVRVMIEAANRIGLMRDITTIVAEMNLQILDFSLRHQDDRFVVRSLMVDVTGYDQLDDLIRRLESVRGVTQVMREVVRPHQSLEPRSADVRSQSSESAR